jgi:hypothetical protein
VPITRLALETFARMQRLEYECTCPPRDPGSHDYERCPACTEYWKLHNILSDEVQAKVWEFPCVVAPSDDDHDGNGRDNPALKWVRLARQRYVILNEALRRLTARE